MYRSVAPSMFHEVERLHEEQPRLIYSPHAFTREIARRLHAIDARWGDNGKRGNANDLSEDCVAFKAPGSPAGGVEIYDIIAGANSPSASPAWIDQTQVTADKGTVGVWVRPQGAVTPVPTPVPAPSPQPTPTPTPAPSCRFAALDLEAVRAIVRDELARARPADDASNDVAALRERVEAINAEMHEMVVGQVNGLLQAIQAIRR
jgi:hypothetical protein